MNYVFSAFIGRWMDVYLDDIIIYSNTLSKNKLHFLCKELKVLGRIIDDDGIRMDPAKVDSVVAWKTPTNQDLLRGFLGSVGYLANDLAGVRVPMGVLTALTGDTVPFRWEFTQQRALKYDPGHAPIFMITDGCATGISGLVSQGTDWKSAKVSAFYSAKLNSAQQNYVQGTHFQWVTDHKGLIHLLNQKNLSGRQTRWMEKIGEFDFEVVYIPGA